MIAHSPSLDFMVMFGVLTRTLTPSRYVPPRKMIVSPDRAAAKAVLMLLYGALIEPLAVASLPFVATYMPFPGSVPDPARGPTPDTGRALANDTDSNVAAMAAMRTKKSAFLDFANRIFMSLPSFNINIWSKSIRPKRSLTGFDQVVNRKLKLFFVQG